MINDCKWSNTTKKRVTEITSLQKLKSTKEIMPDTLCQIISYVLRWDI